MAGQRSLASLGVVLLVTLGAGPARAADPLAFTLRSRDAKTCALKTSQLQVDPHRVGVVFKVFLDGELAAASPVI